VANLDPAISVRPDANLMDVVNLMIKHKAHRILVTDQGSKAVNLITQSKVIVMLRTVAESIPLMSKTIAELQLGMNREPIFVTEDQKALDAFRLMKQEVCNKFYLY
jgi:predicted transcriptional regulator